MRVNEKKLDLGRFEGNHFVNITLEKIVIS